MIRIARRTLSNLRGKCSNATDPGDTGKVLVAVLLRERTAVGNRWVAQRLAMGHTGSVSRLVGAFGKKKEELTKLRELEEMLQCDS
ncbi:MAG: hypothetical protein OSA84_12080 [Akkermansiaceae bacterium]|nr:hypothetical protein [Akkermansiaceae bacterium]